MEKKKTTETLRETAAKFKELHGGRISKLGEWLISGEPTGYYIDRRHMRAILK